MAFSDWTYLFFFFLGLFLLIVIAEVIRHRLGASPEATRKTVHIVTGLLVALTPFVLHSMWPMVILGAFFTLADYIAVKYHLLKSMHGTRRSTYGTVFYPLSFVLLVLLLWDHNRIILIISMLIMALADAAAGIVGEVVHHPRTIHFGPEKKSVQGSTAMFLCSFVIIGLLLSIFPEASRSPLGVTDIIWISAISAFIATMCEVVSFRGSDNLTVPLGAAFALYYMLNESRADAVVFTIGMGLASLLAFLSYRLKFLDASGSVATLILGTLVFGVGGWAFTFPILTFFILSSLLSKAGKKRKKRLDSIFEKTGCRDLWQVLANGGIAGLVLLFWYFFPDPLLYLFYLGSLAAVTADTWGTELGVLAKKQPVSILNFQSVPLGTSGGISFIGTAGALLGSVVLVGVGALSSPYRLTPLMTARVFVLLTLAGFIAALFDSFLGATVQAQYQCTVCHKMTEKKNHCQVPSRLLRGYAWMNNDVVNILCAIAGVALVWAGWLVIK
jgi:uncharacterized protein (TIGR00297 family)